MTDPEGALEAELIAEFLRSRGVDIAALSALDEHHRKPLLEQASAYATGRLAEISARAHYVQDLHHRD
jgi:hypothetical protein